MAKVPLFKVTALSKAFDDRLILNKLSFFIYTGEIIAFTGSSGVGKSTLLKLLAGLIKADSGEVFFENTSLKSNAQQLIPGHEEIKYMEQDFKLLHRRTVQENLSEALLAFNTAFTDQKIEQLTAIFKLEDIAHQYVEQLSGGEKQRLAMARAMATEPQALLLDEPFTQLDQLNRSVLFEALKTANKKLKTTLIFITHQTDEIFQLADRVGVIDDGKLLQFDMPKKVYLNPSSQEIARIFGEINSINDTLSDALAQRNLNFAKYTYGIRPSHIVIDSEQVKGSLAALVKECLFMGAFYEVSCTVGESISWKIYTDSPFKAGDEVFVSFNKKDLIKWER